MKWLLAFIGLESVKDEEAALAEQKMAANHLREVGEKNCEIARLAGRERDSLDDVIKGIVDDF